MQHNNYKTVKATNGDMIEYEIKSFDLGMKDVHFSSDNKHVVAFYRTRSDYLRKRLENLIYKYNPTSHSEAGTYWENLFLWPTHIIDDKRLGYVVPVYPKHFFFTAGFNRNKEKNGRWFSSPKLRKMLDPSERGDWRGYMNICILISRAIRRMHSIGLTHSDLSYNNVLIDPKGGHACILNFDEFIVPGEHPLEVIGTPDFIAPEVLQTMKYPFKDIRRKYPSIRTDRYALAVLNYELLLCRHPLRGGKKHDLDPAIDERLMMGERALFIEHPADTSNRPEEKPPAYMPWIDVEKIPYTICGPYLKELFDKVFIDGLHNPHERPYADAWEEALIKTVDLLQPCGDSSCEQKWFLFDNSTKPKCPFCGWEFTGQLPIEGSYKEESCSDELYL